jgi:copper homeostasis protein
LMQSIREHVHFPVHVMIRPRPGDFCYSNYELEIMRNDIQVAKQFHMDGVVLGILREDARVDVERTKMLVEYAHPLPVTFHRAFDIAKNPATALEDVIKTGSTRILTSGGEPRATDGLSILRYLVDTASGRILIMPCGGIDSGNITRIVRATSAVEIHTSVGTSNPRPSNNGDTMSDGKDEPRSPAQFMVFEQNVTELVNLLANISPDEVVRGD